MQFFGFQTHHTLPEMTRKVRMRPVIYSLPPREGVLFHLEESGGGLIPSLPNIQKTSLFRVHFDFRCRHVYYIDRIQVFF